MLRKLHFGVCRIMHELDKLQLRTLLYAGPHKFSYFFAFTIILIMWLLQLDQAG